MTNETHALPMELPVAVPPVAQVWTKFLHEHAVYTWWGLASNELRVHAERFVHMGESLTSVEAVLGYAGALRNFHEQLRGMQNQGTWIGYLYPSFLEHMIREEAWLQHVLSTGMVSFASIKMMLAANAADTAAVVGKLLDPVEQPMQRAAETRSADLRRYQTAAPEDFAALTEAVQDLWRFEKSPELARAKKILPLEMGDHEMAEDQHFMALAQMFYRTAADNAREAAAQPYGV